MKKKVINMTVKQLALFSTVALCGSLVACSGSPKPAVEPAAAPAAPAAPARVVADMNDPVNRYSYALGMDLGKAVSNINVPLNMKLVMDAISDQVDSTRPALLTDSVAEVALQELLLKMQAKKDADAKAAAQKTLDEQAQFLAKNIMDTTVKVTPKGVQYKILKDAEGISPKAEDKVLVHYVGALLDGTEFDNSVKRGEPLEFPVGAVIEGWQDLLQVMKEGQKVKAWIPSALAYGEEGVSSIIPGNSMLVFEVELLKVNVTNPEPAPAAEAKPAEVPAEKPAEGAAAAPATEPAPAAQPAKAEAKKTEAKPSKSDSKKK
ncbi:FKBP-type peptidyl-prolyl cis-trans isomerase [Fibrobacter sp. UWEL]|uniref:FKBP-type peptidyl-prolyl cis-trans isomerase n=1 Tax=Fibrobacter sp. UWEL TaxID=1896209 RepID=UPI000922E2E2|nr:FKBP-type peptidyl-prolyl cis-trans isomerase [Fibrobacter sp. UWEL]SHL35426.1 FKBP-type peptidyl-prolyl cis-trans isomerase FkpA/FKBP-type peptidyl-prolyl cis-trans isomerase FklB [Fibrobacter sp. UWEL]